mgnify:CR=1 FL=1
MKKLIEKIELNIKNPSKGLPDDIFYLVGRLTPYINVDLLVKNDLGQTLLSWRDETSFNNSVGSGWHIPGGIIRFKELAETRVKKVAEKELDATVSFLNKPLEINEIMNKDRDVRGHFLSLLYECKLTSPLNEANMFDINSPKNGSWRWFQSCPENLIYQHEIYRDKIGL